MRFPVVHQSTETDCGAACLVMIARYYGISVGLPAVRSLLGTGQVGSSLKGIAIVGRWLGLRSEAFFLNPAELGEISLPAILTFRDHFVVIYQLNGKSAYIVDPNVGPVTIKRKDLCRDWTGGSLSFGEPPVTRAPCGLKLLQGLGQRDRILPAQGPLFWLAVFVISALISAASLIAPLISQRVMDQLGELRGPTQLLKFAVLTVLILVGTLLLNGLRRVLVQRSLQRIYLKQASLIVHRILNSPFSFLSGFGSSDFLSRIEETEGVLAFYVSRFIETLLEVVICVTSLMLAVAYSGLIGIFAIFVLGAALVLSLRLSKNLAQRESRINRARVRSVRSYLEIISNIALIKSFSHRELFLAKWTNEHRKYQGLRGEQELRHILSTSVVQLITRGLPTLVLLIGVELIIQKSLTLGQLFALLGFVSLAGSSTLSISAFFNDMMLMRASKSRVQELLDSPDETTVSGQIDVPTIELTSAQFEPVFRFSEVGFRYPGVGAPWVFRNLSFEISYPGTVAIMGPSGTGKTTFLSLLMRLYPTSRGTISCGGISVEALPIQDYRALFSVADQEGTLVVGTLVENIALAESAPDLARVVWALKMAEAYDFVMQLPAGLATHIYSPTGNFSKGQRQRLILARALYPLRKVLLLDEATSQLDKATETRILDNLAELRGKVALIFVTHRADVARWCDRTIHLSNGILDHAGSSPINPT